MKEANREWSIDFNQIIKWQSERASARVNTSIAINMNTLAIIDTHTYRERESERGKDLPIHYS